MMRKKIIFIIVAIIQFIFISCSSKIISQSKNKEFNELQFYVSESVINANDKNEKEIIGLWHNYLNSGEYKNKESIYWSFDEMKVPDYFLWALGIEQLKSRTPKVQCNVIGVFPVENNYYALKCSFAHIDNNKEIQLDDIITVYAKKFNDKFLLVNSTQYHKNVWKKQKVGEITYYIHPEHIFNLIDAKKMSKFNQNIAEKFGIKPLKFDYFVSNYAREIVQVWGYDYMPKMYIPTQSGGVADIDNSVIYAGNNSEYYPHELVHMYTNAKFPIDYHFWVSEGIATFFGGSGGMSLDWHLKQLKLFLNSHPNFRLNSLKELSKYIPNGKHNTDFRYVIGGLIAKKIYEKEGISGFFDALKKVKTDDEYFKLIKDKLGIKRDEFEKYIRAEVNNN